MSSPHRSEPDSSPGQRRWPRYQFQVPVRILLERNAEPEVVRGLGTEMNEGGIAVYAGIELQVGEPVQVEFTVWHSGQALRVRGVVRNRPGDGYYYGIAFLPQSAEDRNDLILLRQLLRSAAGHLDS